MFKIPMFQQGGLLHAWWITNRWEFVAAIGIIVIGIPWALVLQERFRDPQLPWLLGLGLLIWVLAASIGASLNCIGDYSTDQLDEANKVKLSHAVDRVGFRRLWLINLTEIVMVTLLVSILTIHLARPILLLLWLLGLTLAFIYSYEPFKTKRRNLLNPITVVSGTIMVPMLFEYALLSEHFSNKAIAVIVLFSFQVIALSLADELSDYEVDVKTNMITPCVRYGRIRTIRFSLILYSLISVGMLLALLSLWPPQSWIQIGILLTSVTLFARVAWELNNLRKLSHSIDQRGTLLHTRNLLVLQLKRQVTTPRWLAFTGLGTWIVIVGNLLS